MKLKSLFNLALLSAALVAGHASAATCSLSVSQQYIPVGTYFSYQVSVREILPGPLPPPSVMLYRVYFSGQNPNGAWIGYEPAPRDLPLGGGTFTGYYNPGGVSGTYARYAIVLRTDGQYVCTTNTVFPTLQ